MATGTTDRGASDAFAQALTLRTLTVVVHCVGEWDYPKIAELTEAEIDRALALNLRSALLPLRESARHVADGVRVVLLLSVATDVAPAKQWKYVAAKAGLEAAAKELASRGITVNVVRPGATDTENLRAGTSNRAIEAMATSNAMRRLGTPDDIAGAVMMLVSPDAAWGHWCHHRCDRRSALMDE